MSVFITYNQPPRAVNITFEELLSGMYDDYAAEAFAIKNNFSNTRTVCLNKTPDRLKALINVPATIERLVTFANQHSNLYEVQNRHELYDTFFIPKSSGGLRQINAPKPELMNALRELKSILASSMIADHHTAAYAYVTGRCTVDAVGKHQSWGSKWFLKLDIHDFFGSTTKDFVLHTFSRIYPFDLIMKTRQGYDALSKAIDLAFLDRALPQGTPISPFITNVMMIPFDWRVSNKLHSFTMSSGRKERFVYTRYADDMHISCRVDFNYKEIERYIIESLNWMGAPFQINKEKTHYGNINGKNWMLGLMLNKDNEITVGHRRKREFKVMAANYLMDRQNGKRWVVGDIQHMQGEVSYLEMVEPVTMKKLIKNINDKFGVDFKKCVASDLSV